MNQYAKRIQKFQTYLNEYKVDSFLIEDPIDLLYLTGFELSLGRLLITSNSSILVVDARYFEHCQNSSSGNVQLLKGNFNEELCVLLQESHSKALGIDKAKMSVSNFTELQQTLSKSVQGISIVPSDNPVNKLRLIKEPSEIEALTKAAFLGNEGFQLVCSLLKEGISEIELAIELEIFWKRHGGRKLAFDPIIAFGPNSSMPHYRSGSARLNKGQNVLIDIGVQLNHYNSDMTRVVFFGEPNPKILEIYKIVQKAVEKALSLCKPGHTVGELDVAAREVIGSHGYGEFFTHSLGHGIGLETHEFPVIRNKEPVKDIKLEAGMVFTVEPGIYLPGIGGIRLEDTIVITEKGYENLTNLPLEVQVF